MNLPFGSVPWKPRCPEGEEVAGGAEATWEDCTDRDQGPPSTCPKEAGPAGRPREVGGLHTIGAFFNALQLLWILQKKGCFWKLGKKYGKCQKRASNYGCGPLTPTPAEPPDLDLEKPVREASNPTRGCADQGGL